MEAPTNDTLKRVIRLMKPQNNCEKFEILQSVAASIQLQVDFKKIEFNKEDFFYSPFPIPLNRVCSTVVFEDYLYIYCINRLMHIINLKTKHHFTKTIENPPKLLHLFWWILQIKFSSFAFKFKKSKQNTMEKGNLTLEELINYLQSIPESGETLDSETEDMLSGIINGMEKEELLKKGDEVSVFEITVKNGTFLCLLDNHNRIDKLFKIKSEEKK